MDHTTTLSAIAGALVLAALQLLPDVVFLLQCVAIGTFIGTTISYLRGADADKRFQLIYRWSCGVAMLGFVGTIINWIAG